MSSYYKIHQNICQNTIPKFIPAHISTANHQLHQCTHRNLCGLRVLLILPWIKDLLRGCRWVIPHPRRLRIGRGRCRGTTPTVGGRGWGGGPRCRRGRRLGSWRGANRGGGMPLPECHPSHPPWFWGSWQDLKCETKRKHLESTRFSGRSCLWEVDCHDCKLLQGTS